MKYKGGLIARMSEGEAGDFDDERNIKYHVTYPQGFTDGHGATIKYVSSIKAGKYAINDSRECVQKWA